MASDEEVDQNVDSLDEIDGRTLASIIMCVDATEVFSPARVNKLAAKFGLMPGASLVLTNGSDFSRAEDRTMAWNLIKNIIALCYDSFPPCTLSSRLQALNNYVHRDDPECQKAFEEKKRTATQHINF